MQRKLCISRASQNSFIDVDQARPSKYPGKTRTVPWQDPARPGHASTAFAFTDPQYINNLPSSRAAICLGKAKVVLDSINRHTSGSLDFKEILELEERRESLKYWVVRMEKCWKEGMLAINDKTIFDGIARNVKTAKEAVDEALFESGKFLQENSVQTSAGTTSSASCTNGNTRLGGTFSALKSKF
jgi:hypothetical protein